MYMNWQTTAAAAAAVAPPDYEIENPQAPHHTTTETAQSAEKPTKSWVFGDDAITGVDYLWS